MGRKGEKMFDVTITRRCHNLLSSHIKQGDFVVDATMGRGEDTLFLLEAVGKEGQVMAFDIQEKALEGTEKKLEEKGLLAENICLFCEGHEKMDEYIKKPPQAIMFNLGYLPKGNHQVSTKGDVSTKAIAIGLSLLNIDGIMSVITYPGHEEGLKEQKMVVAYLENLNAEHFEVLSFLQTNRSKTAPQLYLIHKRK